MSVDLHGSRFCFDPCEAIVLTDTSLLFASLDTLWVSDQQRTWPSIDVAEPNDRRAFVPLIQMSIFLGYRRDVVCLLERVAIPVFEFPFAST
jgi:hypothetical protein